ncbi:MAG: efflux RND transporter periplasmic adaptor subunit [Deltaproteobacteria bacterium]|nr:efflux RND transporter periplasmic adaptor subunit [Deltaproteobacteria bacterium]
MSLKIKRLALFMTIFVFYLLLCGYGPAFARNRVPVSTVKVGLRTIESTLELKGSVKPFAEVTVFSKVTGVIEKLLVEKGDRVKKGDVIAVVEHSSELAQRKQLVAQVESARVAVRQAEAAVRIAEASLSQAEAQLENAILEKNRAENLLKDKSMPRQRYDAVMAQFKVARAGKALAEANIASAREAVFQSKAGLARATAALEQLDVRIADFTIRAPISGVISGRFVDEGAMDNPRLPIVAITNMDILKVISQVTETDVARIRKGARAIVSVDAYPHDQFQGTIAIVNPTLDPKSHTMGFEIYIKDNKALLKPGMFARITLHLGMRKVLALPRECLLQVPGTGVYYAFVVENGVAKKRPDIKLGIRKGDLVEVRSGLVKGDDVVISGQGLLKTGTPVIIRGYRGKVGRAK